MMRFVLLELLGLFKAFRSALFPPACRFSPSCSEYAEDAVKIYGPIRAVPRILRRLLRCHPFHPGGYDPVSSGAR